MTQGRAPGTARVFTIPPGAPFLPTLAEALLDGTLVPGFSRDAGPLGLAAATLYVPTRRSARALAAVFAEALSGGTHAPGARPGPSAALLPRILPLGALDDTELLFDDEGLGRDLAPDLPVAVGDITRRMVLTRLILAWGEAVRHAIVSVDAEGRRILAEAEPLLVATSPADAWHLSGELAGLIDELVIEDVAWTKISPLGTEPFDRYWRITMDFLDVAITRYPEILAGRNEVDLANRQKQLIEAEIARLHAAPGRGPVIVAGSTGSNSATARLIAAVARLPNGAVVLPGLDQTLDEAAWSMIGAPATVAEPLAGHPQAALARLITTIGTGRAEVLPLGRVAESRRLRARLVAEALRPAETTHLWQGLDIDRMRALDGVTLVEAEDDREEALAIAVALREALEGPGTAALVTPDRALARRVREDLTRWSIDIEESSGEPLSQTPAGALARLVVDCALRDLAAGDVLAVLHHPAVRLRRSRAEVLRLTGLLDRQVLRDPFAPATLAEPDAFRSRPAAEADAALLPFIEDLVAALAPVRASPEAAPLPHWLAAHEAALALLLEDEAGTVAPDGQDFGVLAELFEELETAADPAIRLDCPGYGALFQRLAAERAVRRPRRSHPRLKILGLLEARLLGVDRIILGGLDEGVWPPAARTDPFLNRPMRAALGLSPPERRIGRTAHDFEMAMGQAEVIVTRAKKRGREPTVPSRFLQRLEAVAREEAWSLCRARGDRYLALARALDQPLRSAPLPRPMPRPPVALRPQKLSVTRIETLRRDPYALYAEKVLGLVPLEPLAGGFGAAQFGTLFHGVVSGFSTQLDTGWPGDAQARFARALRETFAAGFAKPVFEALDWPRIEGWGRAYLAFEQAQRPACRRVLVETRGELVLPLADGTRFTLTAVADRIEVDDEGALTIVDYKTGEAPGVQEVRVGFAPQLTLEAAMAARGAFRALEPAAVKAARYVRFRPGDTVELRDLVWKTGESLAEVAAEHLTELVLLLEAFNNERTPYPPRPFPKYASRFGTYDHLARIREWSASGGLDASEGEA